MGVEFLASFNNTTKTVKLFHLLLYVGIPDPTTCLSVLKSITISFVEDSLRFGLVRTCSV